MQPIAPIVDQKAKYRAFLQLITVPNIRPEWNSHVSKLHAAVLSNPTIGLKFLTWNLNYFWCICSFTTFVWSIKLQLKLAALTMKMDV